MFIALSSAEMPLRRILRELLADRLLSMLSATATEDWCWFENGLAYDNPRLSQAMIQTGLATRRPEYIEAGLRSLRWLMSLQTSPPVSSDRSEPRVSASLASGPKHSTSSRSRRGGDFRLPRSGACRRGAEWPAGARRAFAWFLGENDLKTTLIDSDIGSCSDGLHPDRPNENSGAESVLSYLLGLVEIRQFERAAARDRAKPRPIARPAAHRSAVAHERSRGGVCPSPSFSTARLCICARIRRGSSCDPSDRPLSRETSIRSTGRGPTISSTECFGWIPKPLATDGKRAGEFRRPSPEPDRYFRDPRRRDGSGFEPHAISSQTQRRLIGAYFLHEYSFEASALFNPSIVRHPDQAGAPENGCRFILSLRAVGEGHISSLTFRSGSIAADGSVTIDPAARLASVPKVAAARSAARRSKSSSAPTTSSANA